MTRSADPGSLAPETGIRPIARWGSECARGWISDPRFAGSGNATVIKRKPRKKRPANSSYAGGGAL